MNNQEIKNFEEQREKKIDVGFFGNLKKLFYRIFRREGIILCIKGFRYKGHLIWRIDNTQEETQIELCDIRVVSNERGKGYGTEMLRKLEEIAKRKRKNRIFVFTADWNKPAQSFYKNNGFQEVSNLEEFFPKAKMLVKKIY